MDYIYITKLTLGTPRGENTQVGVTEITASEIRFDQLNAVGERTNPNGLNAAIRTTTGIPTPGEMLVDIEASLPAE